MLQSMSVYTIRVMLFFDCCKYSLPCWYTSCSYTSVWQVSRCYAPSSRGSVPFSGIAPTSDSQRSHLEQPITLRVMGIYTRYLVSQYNHFLFPFNSLSVQVCSLLYLFLIDTMQPKNRFRNSHHLSWASFRLKQIGKSVFNEQASPAMSYCTSQLTHYVVASPVEWLRLNNAS